MENAGKRGMSNLEAIAEAIGEAVMDAIEQKRRINKADLVDAAHNVLRRRHALLGMGTTLINYRPPGMEPRPSKLPRLIVRSPDGSVRRVTEEEAAVLYGACCQRDTP